MRIILLFHIFIPLLIFGQKHPEKEFISEKGFLVYTDESYYFIPFMGEQFSSVEQDFASNHLGVGFGITYVGVHINIDSLMSNTPIYRKQNFPDTLPQAYNSMHILPDLVEIHYIRSKVEIKRGVKAYHYIADILGRRVEYDYDFRDHIIMDIMIMKE